MSPPPHPAAKGAPHGSTVAALKSGSGGDFKRYSVNKAGVGKSAVLAFKK